MKFSLIYEAQLADRSRESEARTFHEMLEQCRLAEELGFEVQDEIEHHGEFIQIPRRPIHPKPY